MNNLKPCPFCGKTGAIAPSEFSDGLWLVCPHCNATGPLAKRDGVLSWNTRPIEQTLSIQLEELAREQAYSHEQVTQAFTQLKVIRDILLGPPELINYQSYQKLLLSIASKLAASLDGPDILEDPEP